MSTAKYPNEINLNFETGGREAIERLIYAYGFTTRQALADHLKVSKSTLANRYLRDTFPSDWIIKCSIETGASLMWLTTGNGPVYEDVQSDVVAISTKKIINGELFDSNFFLFDKTFLPTNLNKPLSIIENESIYLAEAEFGEATDGKWLVEIEGKYSVRELTRIPVNKVKVQGHNASFECLLSEIKIIAKCVGIYKEI